MYCHTSTGPNGLYKLLARAPPRLSVSLFHCFTVSPLKKNAEKLWNYQAMPNNTGSHCRRTDMDWSTKWKLSSFANLSSCQGHGKYRCARIPDWLVRNTMPMDSESSPINYINSWLNNRWFMMLMDGFLRPKPSTTNQQWHFVSVSPVAWP